MTMKYYAVVRGWTPGIYTEWFGEFGAEANTRGFSGCKFKSFNSLDEAKEWYQEKSGEEAHIWYSIMPGLENTDYGYLVPYQTNINKALQELRFFIFSNGLYEISGRRTINRDELREALLSEMRDFSQPKPLTIERVVYLSGDYGTHSILDFKGISQVPTKGFAFPFSSKELLELFDTEQPTRSDVIENELEILEKISYQSCVYIVIFKEGKVDEVYFGFHYYD